MNKSFDKFGVHHPNITEPFNSVGSEARAKAYHGDGFESQFVVCVEWLILYVINIGPHCLEVFYMRNGRGTLSRKIFNEFSEVTPDFLIKIAKDAQHVMTGF